MSEDLIRAVNDQTLREMRVLLIEAIYPKVQFTGNLEEMRQEAIEYCDTNVRRVLTMIDEILKS